MAAQHTSAGSRKGDPGSAELPGFDPGEGHLFLIETFVIGPHDSAYADDEGGAFLAVVELLKAAGCMNARAKVTNLESSEVVWEGRRPYWVSS